MSSLNLDWIKQDASRRLLLTEKIGELQLLVDELYPGHKVLIEMPEPKSELFKVFSSTVTPPPVKSPNLDPFSSMNGIGKMEFLLNERPLSSKELYMELVRKGVPITLPTVMSTLSRKKELFQKTVNGKWELVKSREENREST